MWRKLEPVNVKAVRKRGNVVSEEPGVKVSPAAAIAKEWKERVDQGVSVSELRDLFDHLDVSGDGTLSGAEVACLLDADTTPYGLPTNPTFCFKYCGGYAQRWKDKRRLRASNIPPTLSFDEFCTAILASTSR